MRKIITLGIMLLFIGMGIVSSTGNIVENKHSYHRSLKSVDNSEEILYVETIWYSYVYMGSMGTGFYAYGPGIDTRFREWEGNISGGTWTNDGRWLCCIYGNGTLYDIDPKTFDVSVIGGGGTSLNGLAYNPVNEKLYGASGTGSTGGLWKIDIETGEQDYIGDFGSTNYMIGIAFDADGVLYGWAILPDSLFTIDLDSGEATEVGPLGININYAQDGAFDLYNDILYLTAYTTSGGLYECDEDTGQCTLIGNLQGECTAHAISYELNMTPPVTNISFDPLYPDGDNGWHVSNVTVTLNALDDTGVIATYYRINGGEWKTYDSPFVISEDGDDILIEYYSVDYIGNIEDVKSSTVDIDKTPPDIEEVTWDAFKDPPIYGYWYVKFTCDAVDETSGMDRVEFFINDGEHEIVVDAGPTYTFTIQWSKLLKTATFKFIFCDVAGNYANATINGSDINSHPRFHSQLSNTESNGELSLSICSDEPFGIRTVPDSSYTKNFYNLKECSAGRKIAYGYCCYSPFYEGPWWFYLDNPEFDFKWLQNTASGAFLTGGTWANEERWIACEYYTGALWKIDPENGDMESIGGGGSGLNGLAYNPVNEKLYGASRSGLWLIDLETGEQEYIGDFVNSVWMVGIAFDADGVLYGWDINPDYLYTIDTETGEATAVGPLSIDLNYGQDGAFEFEDDILYLAAYTTDGHQALYKCDEDTGECTLVGPLAVGGLTAVAIPYGGQLPIKPYISGPQYGRPGLPNIFHVDKEENTCYVWNWGDGNYSSSPSYKWAKLGTYNVSVTARNIYGAIDSDPINIKIEDFRFNKALVFGRIHDVDIIENLTMIKADSLLYLGKPDLIKWYHSGERIIISETLFGRIKSDFVIGFFNVDVIG